MQNFLCKIKSPADAFYVFGDEARGVHRILITGKLGARRGIRTHTVLVLSEMPPSPWAIRALVVLLGLEPRLGTNLVLLVYKTSDATLHHRTIQTWSHLRDLRSPIYITNVAHRYLCLGGETWSTMSVLARLLLLGRQIHYLYVNGAKNCSYLMRINITDSWKMSSEILFFHKVADSYVV